MINVNDSDQIDGFCRHRDEKCSGLRIEGNVVWIWLLKIERTPFSSLGVRPGVHIVPFLNPMSTSDTVGNSTSNLKCYRGSHYLKGIGRTLGPRVALYACEAGPMRFAHSGT